MSTLKELEAFVQVANKGSLAAAARSEGVTPAIIGRRLDALEDRPRVHHPVAEGSVHLQVGGAEPCGRDGGLICHEADCTSGASANWWGAANASWASPIHTHRIR